jgi:dephospho-CoA kinase
MTPHPRTPEPFATLKPPQRPVRIGLTGGIGSGKSTVAQMLRQLGCQVVDADAISRASTAPGGAAMPAIAQAFGPGFLTAEGALNRDAMRQLIFTNPDAKKQLESIIHPIVRQQIEAACNTPTAPCVVLDIPLLAESRSWQARVDTIWVVDCSPETQIQRVMQRNGWAREQVEPILAQQASREQRLGIANTVLLNDQTTIDELKSQVDLAYGNLQAQFGL